MRQSSSLSLDSCLIPHFGQPSPNAIPQPSPFPPLPKTPLVSILMPNYNYARYIPKAIQSVLDQTYSHWELIVSDDGSTDNSLDVIANFLRKYPRIKLIQKPNAGVASAINQAFYQSAGNIICFLDSDDVFAPEKLATIVSQFQCDPCLGYVTHKMQFIDANGVKGHIFPLACEHGYLRDKIYARGGFIQLPPSSAICLRKELADIIFPIDETHFRQLADAYIYTLAGLLTKTACLNDVLSFYRVHGSNLTHKDTLHVDSILHTRNNILHYLTGVNNKLHHMGYSPIDIMKNSYLHTLETRLALCQNNLNSREAFTLIVKFIHSRMCDRYLKARERAYAFLYVVLIFFPQKLRSILLMKALKLRRDALRTFFSR